MSTIKKKTPLKMFGSTVKFLVLSMFLVIVLFPFIWMFITSIKGSQAEIYAFPIIYWPETPSLDNYINIFKVGNFGKYFLNSFIVSTCAATVSVIFGIFGGYVLARFKFRLKKGILFFFLFTQMIPMFVMLAPLYEMMAEMHMVNNLWGLCILYINMTIPFSLVTLRGFFQGVPKELEEAAQIDGCGRMRALFKVILPVIMPGIASTFIFAFVNSWNELFVATMFVDVDAYRTIPVALNSLILKYDIKWGEMAAGTIVAILPTMAMFTFAQKYMAAGLTAGAVKG